MREADVQTAVAEQAGTASGNDYVRAGSAPRRAAAPHRRGAARRAARPASLRLVADSGRLVGQEPGQRGDVQRAAVRTAAARHPAAARRETTTRETATAAARIPVRLTRRGRMVLTAAAVLTIGAVSMVVAGAAQATGHSGAPAGPGRGVVKVQVRPGDSLWSLAEAYDSHADTRLVIQDILQLNSMNGDQVQPGQVLWVPRG
jgi:nucleoid-associated protein YgaU